MTRYEKKDKTFLPPKGHMKCVVKDNERSLLAWLSDVTKSMGTNYLVVKRKQMIANYSNNILIFWLKFFLNYKNFWL